MRLILAAAMILSVSLAQAQDYPSRTIRLIVPYAAGGASDLTARLLAQTMSQQIGKQVIVENKVGGNTVVGTEAVATAPADGYTLLLQTITYAANATLIKDLPYNVDKDLKPVSLIAINPLVLVANKNVPANNIKELVAYLKDNPRTPYGTSGNGGAMHLAGELFKLESGADALHVPYRGESPAVNDLLGGRISLTFGSFAVMAPHFPSGALKPIAVLGPERSPLAPNVPTAIESGLPNYMAYTWNAIFVPAGASDVIVKTLNSAINKAMADPETNKKMRELGFVPVSDSTPESALAYVQDEIRKWKTVIEKANIKLD